MTKSRGIGRGGARRGAGHPRGSRNLRTRVMLAEIEHHCNFRPGDPAAQAVLDALLRLLPTRASIAAEIVKALAVSDDNDRHPPSPDLDDLRHALQRIEEGLRQREPSALHLQRIIGREVEAAVQPLLRQIVELRRGLGLTELHRPAQHSRRRPLGTT